MAGGARKVRPTRAGRKDTSPNGAFSTASCCVSRLASSERRVGFGRQRQHMPERSLVVSAGCSWSLFEDTARSFRLKPTS